MARDKTGAAAPDRTPEHRAPDMMGSMLAVQQASLAPLRLFGTAWLESASEMGSEVMQFLSERIQEDLKTRHLLLHCRDPLQLQAIQMSFFEKAMDQYAAETGKLVELGQGMFEKATRGPRQ